MADNDCLFCKIIAGEIPSTKVYEDDVCYAFDDVNPVMPVHTLVVPKKHYVNLLDEIPNEELGHLFNAAAKVAHIKGIDISGFRTITNAGKDAKQSVFHFHIHVMGGGPMLEGSPAENDEDNPLLKK